MDNIKFLLKSLLELKFIKSYVKGIPLTYDLINFKIRVDFNKNLILSIKWGYPYYN